MKRFLAVVLLVLPLLARPVEVDPARERAIWNAAARRFQERTDVWWEEGDYPRIIQLLRFQVALDPKDYERLDDLAWMLNNVEDTAGALALYVRMTRRFSDSPDGPISEAEFYFHRRAYAKVPPLLEPVIERGPQPNIYRMLAHSYERMGLLADALRVWDLYLAKSPDDAAAKNNRERVKRKLAGEVPSAREP